MAIYGIYQFLLDIEANKKGITSTAYPTNALGVGVLTGGCCMAINTFNPALEGHGRSFAIYVPKERIDTYKISISEEELLYWLEYGKSIGINARYAGKVYMPLHLDRTTGVFYKILFERTITRLSSNTQDRYPLYVLSFFRYLFNSCYRYREIYETTLLLEKLLPKHDRCGLLGLAHIWAITKYTGTSITSHTEMYSCYYGLVISNMLQISHKLLESTAVLEKVKKTTNSAAGVLVTASSRSRSQKVPNIVTAVAEKDVKSLEELYEYWVIKSKTK